MMSVLSYTLLFTCVAFIAHYLGMSIFITYSQIWAKRVNMAMLAIVPIQTDYSDTFLGYFIANYLKLHLKKWSVDLNT